MYGAKQVRKGDPPRDAGVREAIERLIDDRVSDAAAKDLPLVEAALDADRVIVSLDRRAREAYKLLTADARQLRDMSWANPESAGCVAWVRAGFPDSSDWHLGNPF